MARTRAGSNSTPTRSRQRHDDGDRDREEHEEDPGQLRAFAAQPAGLGAAAADGIRVDDPFQLALAVAQKGIDAQKLDPARRGGRAAADDGQAQKHEAGGADAGPVAPRSASRRRRSRWW